MTSVPSTQVEILLGYLTSIRCRCYRQSTQVEILLGYLTIEHLIQHQKSTQVEILLGYLTFLKMVLCWVIYTSRNSFRLLNVR